MTCMYHGRSWRRWPFFSSIKTTTTDDNNDNNHNDNPSLTTVDFVILPRTIWWPKLSHGACSSGVSCGSFLSASSVVSVGQSVADRRRCGRLSTCRQIHMSVYTHMFIAVTYLKLNGITGAGATVCDDDGLFHCCCCCCCC